MHLSYRAYGEKPKSSALRAVVDAAWSAANCFAKWYGRPVEVSCFPAVLPVRKLRVSGRGVETVSDCRGDGAVDKSTGSAGARDIQCVLRKLRSLIRPILPVCKEPNRGLSGERVPRAGRYPRHALGRCRLFAATREWGLLYCGFVPLVDTKAYGVCSLRWARPGHRGDAMMRAGPLHGIAACGTCAITCD